MKKKFPYAEVKFKSVNDAESQVAQNFSDINQTQYILLFSGGIDSLALHFLLPDIPLLSIEWIQGNRYIREKSMFEQYRPYTLMTNVRDFARVIGMGSVTLFSKELGFSAILIGIVFEASTSGGAKKMKTFAKHYAYQNRDHLLQSKSFKWYNLHFITEVATMMLVAHYGYDKIPRSLASCANEGSVKRLRKELLAKAVYKRMGLILNFEISKLRKKKSVFGKRFSHDFLAIYITKVLGYKETKKYITIPDNVVNKVENSDWNLTFYERINTNFLDCIPPEKTSEVTARLYCAGITPFTERDWYEFREVATLLRPWHETDVSKSL